MIGIATKVGIVAGAAILAAGGSGVASASVAAKPRPTKTVYAHQGKDRAAVTKRFTSSGSYYQVELAVCDREKDGNKVYARFVMNDRERAYGDPNNSKKGCGLQTFNGDYTVEQFQICEDDAGDDTCSKWQDVD
ncbi:hypothetical protein J4573_52135 [Actinomadura barringtoniae]|uniref:Secreted protein n=1 Tax=Actinomadura barringtoniae TaxID=1427535 RepID=A0A939TDK9_9ACTN|nr:hypothetical protein [Actinomadura barringtoniae]MBO2455707.1 hypothetical protein [Actinomadura barringtoniae]